jgi:16S rRNA (uracil1498-N3)-methyltransferase
MSGPVTLFFGRRAGDRFEFTAEDAHHLARVLRHKAGDRIWALDGEKAVYEVELESIDARRVVGVIVAEHAGLNEPAVPTILMVGTIGQTKMDWLIEKATELGVTAVWPLAGRPQVGPGRLGRWRRIARSAAKQCRRAVVPKVSEPLPLSERLAELPAGSMRILAEPDGTVKLPPLAGKVIVLAVGPEKGFEPGERAALLAAGFHAVSLGLRRLRSETAAMALLALVAGERDGEAGPKTGPWHP